MRPRRFLQSSIAIGLALSVLPNARATNKADNTTNLNVATSWTGSVVPGVFDIATWTNTVSAATATTPELLGTSLSWQGIAVTNPGGAITIGPGNTLTLGSSGINMGSATQDLTIQSGLTLLTNTDQIWTVATGRTLTLNTGAFTRTVGSTLNVRPTGTGVVSVAGLSNDATGIIGAWATYGSGVNTQYATMSGGNIVGYTGTVAATAANVTDTTGAVNYDVAAGGTLGAGASVNTIRYTGSAATVNGALQTNGLLNAGTGLLTFANAITVGASKEFIVNAANNSITIAGAINNNADGASTLTKIGTGTLTLTGLNNGYTGLTTVNGGVLDVGTISNNSLGSGGLLLNNNAILQGNGTFTRGLSTTTPSLPSAGQVASQSGGFAARGGTLTLNFGGAGGQIALNGSGYVFGITLIFGSPTADSKVILVNPVNLNTNGQRTISVTAGTGTDSAELQGVLSDGATGFTPSGFNKTGVGLLILTAANTYTGVTTISGGTVSVSSVANGGTASNLGASAAVATNLVFNGGKLQYTGATGSTNRSFTINAGVTSTIEVTNAATNLTLSGSTTATTGALAKTGAGTLTLTGVNLHTGLNTVSGGVLDVGTISNGSLGSGGLVLSNDSILQGNGTFTRVLSNNGTPTANQVASVNGGFAARGGTLTLNFGGAGAEVDLSTAGFVFGNALDFGSSTADSKVVVVNTINLNSASGTRTFNVTSGVGGDSAELQGAVIQQAGQVSSLTKTGTGTLILSNTNTYTGGTNINAGKVVVSGSLSSTGLTFVAAGTTPGTLASGNNISSTVGAVTLSSDANGGATLSPGDTGGAAATTIGKLNVVGALTLGTTSTAGHAHLAIELGGTTAGTSYDQVSTTGNVSLNSVNLDLSLVNGYGATIGISDTFTIILNGGSGTTTTGTFANAPGNQIVANGITFSVNYGFNADAGAAGNDVQLTVVAVPEPGSWTLLASGLLGALGLGRFRRCRRA